MMNKDRGQMAERILDLTLEIIYLLTGEDYVVMKKSSETLKHGSSLHSQEDFTRKQTSRLVPPPHLLMYERRYDKKILELTNRIIHLLTGGEWEYLEGPENDHKEVKNHQPLNSIGPDDTVTIVSDDDECSDDSDIVYRDAPQIPQIKENTIPYGQGSSQKTDATPPSHQTYAEYGSVSIEEKLVPRSKGVDTKTNPPRQYSPVIIEEEPISCDDDDDDDDELTDTDSYPHTRYTSGAIEEEPPSCEDVEVNAQSFYNTSENFSFLKNTELPVDLHRRTSFNQKLRIYTCSRCQKRFTGNADVLGHDRMEITCSRCSAGSSYDSPLLIEQVFRTVDDLYMCPECGKCFTQLSHLLLHQKIHVGSFFSCYECGKCFGHKKNLNRHLRIHMQDKKYACPVCGKCFSQKNNLATHQKIHTGVKMYSCPECGKCFRRGSHLVIHQRIHTGEKPYACSLCGRMFGDKSNMNKHLKTHVGENSFQSP